MKGKVGEKNRGGGKREREASHAGSTHETSSGGEEGEQWQQNKGEAGSKSVSVC